MKRNSGGFEVSTRTNGVLHTFSKVSFTCTVIKVVATLPLL